ncbi:hypothetical protein WN943_003169 [Citrus x changshan-huyou]
METEELIKKCSAITLEEEEEDRVIFGGSMKEKGAQIAAGCLVGKILTTRGVSHEGIRTALQQAWRPVGVVKVESLRNKIFMFKFSSAEDKRRVLKGGPWHFDRALIVLQEPSGIGNVTEQSFSHVSFWVQLHNVPLMCMDISTIREISSKIGMVEDVATDATGDCFGEYVRVRISIDITKRLKKVIRIQQEDGKEILVGVTYEKLPDYCFCCGYIGHQYRECATYKGQPKEELAYGAWLRALPLPERMRFQRSKERGNRDQSKTTREDRNSESTGTPQLQQLNPKGEIGSGSIQHQDEATSPQISLRHVAELAGEQLMPQERQSREQQVENREQQGAAGNEVVSENVCKSAGNKIEKRHMEKNMGGEKVDKNLEMGHKIHQPISTSTTHMSSDDEGVVDESHSRRTKTKWKRWKHQARSSSKKGITQTIPNNLKRISCDSQMTSSQSKKYKMGSKGECKPSQGERNSPSAKLTSNWDTSAMEGAEEIGSALKEISAEAGFQPRRQQ